MSVKVASLRSTGEGASRHICMSGTQAAVPLIARLYRNRDMVFMRLLTGEQVDISVMEHGGGEEGGRRGG